MEELRLFRTVFLDPISFMSFNSRSFYKMSSRTFSSFYFSTTFIWFEVFTFSPSSVNDFS